jgi:hypothetical protein
MDVFSSEGNSSIIQALILSSSQKSSDDIEIMKKLSITDVKVTGPDQEFFKTGNND